MEHTKTFGPIHIVLACLIGVVLLFNAYQIAGIGSASEPKLPKIEVTLITADCTDCFDMQSVYAELLKGTTYKVENSQELAITDAHAQRLATENNITRLPAIVIEGDTSALALEGTRKSGSVLLIDSPAPYYDVQSSTVKGKVAITYVLADAGTCTDCGNITVLGAQLESAGVFVASETKYTASSEDGKRMIAAYSLTKLPAVVLSPDAAEYELITQTWEQAGDIAPDGLFVLRTIAPPYYDLATKMVRGHVNLINLVDATCTTCYDVSMHKQILLGFGIKPYTEKTLDVSSAEAKELIATNKIEMIPTIVMTGDPQLYPSLQQVWSQVGTAENNIYVFRHTELLPGTTAKNLTNGQLVTQPTQ